MKNTSKVILSITLAVLVGLYMYYSKSRIEMKSSNFKSYQKEFAPSTPLSPPPKVEVSHKEQKREEAPLPQKTSDISLKNKFSRLSPIVNYLNQKTGKWNWSPNVFAIEKNKYQGSKENILGTHDGFTIVKDLVKPKEALSLIYNPTDKRLGIYTGKVIILHEKSTDFENKLHGVGISDIQFIANAYFVSSEKFSDAVSIASNIQKGIPGTQVDVDINYSVATAN